MYLLICRIKYIYEKPNNNPQTFNKENFKRFEQLEMEKETEN